MVARNWRATARRRRADHTRSNSKTAEARIWTFDFSGMPLKSKVHLGNGASITHAFRPGDIQSPAGPASLSEIRELRWIEAA
jgi:hypothetical protein